MYTSFYVPNRPARDRPVDSNEHVGRESIFPLSGADKWQKVDESFKLWYNFTSIKFRTDAP